MGQLVKQVTKISVRPEGEPLFSELNTDIEIDDESAGQFIVVSQARTDVEKCVVRIDREEWPILRDAIEEMVGLLMRNSS